MKKIYIILAGILFLACSSTPVSVESVENKVITEKKQELKEEAIVFVESANVEEKVTAPKPKLVADERRVTKKMQSDVPSGCAMWSDGCNECTRKAQGKASCTTYPACQNRVVSCLRWN